MIIHRDTESFSTIKDVPVGECFCFAGDIFMIAKVNYKNTCISLSNGLEVNLPPETMIMRVDACVRYKAKVREEE